MKRAMMAVMALVTAWSVWAWAEPKAMNMAQEPSHAAAPPAEASPGEASGPSPMNWVEFGRETPPFIATLINFGILAAGYYLLGRKPILAALQNRRDSVAKEIEEAQRMKEEAEERAKVYQAKLEHLEEEMRIARDGLVRAGEAERDRIVAEAEATAERMRRDVTFLVEQEIKQIRQDLFRETLDAAVGAAEDILKRRVTGADQERLAEEFLSELGGKPKGAGSLHPAAAPGAPNPS